jgi:hypothetical protein
LFDPENQNITGKRFLYIYYFALKQHPMTLLRTPLLCGMILVFLIGCRSDDSLRESDLYGRWEVVSAKRSGRSTETLNGAYFDFQKNGQLQSNILGEETTDNYEFKGTMIIQEGEQDISYLVSRLENEQIQLDTRLRNTEFTFILAREKSE